MTFGPDSYHTTIPIILILVCTSAERVTASTAAILSSTHQYMNSTIMAARKHENADDIIMRRGVDEII